MTTKNEGREPFLGRNSIKVLKAYKPHGALDNSLLLRFLFSHLYNFLAPFIPTWVAPNVVTLSGWVGVVTAYILCLVYMPTATETAPTWVYAFCSLAIFAYQTLDNLDGKHAKRMQMGSPLGHLTDHGCDATMTSLIGFITMHVLQQGLSIKGISFFIAGGYAQGYFAIWEEYHTGDMPLGYVNGPMEGLILIWALFAITAYTGPSVWHQSACTTLWPAGPCLIPAEWSNSTFLLVFSVASTVFIVLMCMLGVAKHCQRHNKSFLLALRELLPFVVLLTSLYTTVMFSPTDFFARHPFIFLGAVGFSQTYYVTRMMVCHLTTETFNWIHPLSIIWLLMVVNIVLGHVLGKLPTAEIILFDAAFAWAATAWARLVYGVVRDCQDFLGIPFVTVPKEKRV